MDEVVIGMDPHKASVTIEARDRREVLRATGRFGTDTRSYRSMLKVAAQWPRRVWAVEGANGIGRPITQRLLADGERVLDVPAKLAARARVFDTGQGRKTDATDTHAVVMVALRDKHLREVTVEPELIVLRLLCDRRDELSHARAQALNRLHKLFLHLLPGGAPTKKSTAQYRALLTTVPPRGPGRSDPAAPGRGPAQGHHSPGRPAQGPQSRAERSGAGPRLAPDGHPRRRPGRGGADPGRRRRRGPFP
ncbi:IS110 family transposase [Ornithinimicrobium sediminis]|uniref:IS110 family transposase n=1 Tax=Ornithinimicrobium sediminis TaxID=2904603 RepID=UPI001E4341D6|nr:IS110 family transposase [Ornithinimicrobium sediminis]MCE0488415.1 IS110 family transposase [Ornithinimicrobium sediminis]